MKTLIRCTAIALIFFTIGLGLWYVALPRAELRVRQLMIVDEEGNPRITLSVESNSAFISMVDDKGINAVQVIQYPVQLGLPGSTGYIFVYQDGKPVGSLGKMPVHKE